MLAYSVDCLGPIIAQGFIHDARVSDSHMALTLLAARREPSGVMR